MTKVIVAYRESSDEYLRGIVGVYKSEKTMISKLKKALIDEVHDILIDGIWTEGYWTTEEVAKMSDETVFANTERDLGRISVLEYDLQ